MPAILAVLFTMLMCGGVLCFDDCLNGVNQQLMGAFVHKNRRVNHPLGLTDNQCMAKVVQGGWCSWEPMETGHGVTSCQKGLNIRWRRRICACPQPRPIHDRKAWCRSEKNVSAVAKLKNPNFQRLQALKHEVWSDQAQWDLLPSINRMARLTNSLLGCIELDECYFHTGTTYRGTAKRTQRTNEICEDWPKYRVDIENLGMTIKQIEEFMSTDPKNYCRNPIIGEGLGKSAKIKPWCFTRRDTIANITTWGYCDLPACGAHQFLGAALIPKKIDKMMLSRDPVSRRTGQDKKRGRELNAESCFESCRYLCNKYAALNYRDLEGDPSFACQCLNEEDTPVRDFLTSNTAFDHFPGSPDLQIIREYNKKINLDPDNGPFKTFKWKKCYLFNSEFDCPSIDNEKDHDSIFASLFEVALPSKCYESTHLIGDYARRVVGDPMTFLGIMGNFKMHTVITGSSNWVLLSSRSENSKKLKSLCSHDIANSGGSPKFNASSIDDPASYFNQVVDGGYHWVIIDTGKQEHIALVELTGDENNLMDLEIFVRSVPLPNWLSEGKFTSNANKGFRAVYFGKATEAEKKLWWKCDDIKKRSTTNQPDRVSRVLLQKKIRRKIKYNIFTGRNDANKTMALYSMMDDGI